MMIQGHGKMEELTAKSKEWSASSEEAPKGRFVDGGGWREKECAGDVKSDQNETKT